MSPLPGKPLDPQRHVLTTSEGRKVKLKVPGSRLPWSRTRPWSAVALSHLVTIRD